MADQSKYLSKLHNKRVLVIGGTSGIGYSVAEASVEHGCEVTVASSQPARVESAVASLLSAYPSAKGRVHGYVVDLSIEDPEPTLTEMLEKVTAGKTKLLDHIHITSTGPLRQLPLAQITAADVFVRARMRVVMPLILGKMLLQYVVTSHQSSLTLTSGTIASRPMPGRITESTMGNAVVGVMRGLALELAPVRINIIEPGGVLTPLWDPLSEGEKEMFMKILTEKSTTGRVTGPENVAEAYVYLMKDENVTGQVVKTEGGILLK